jgi:F-type H+-transporting ATPase subunit delta
MIAQEVAKKYARALLTSVKERGIVDLATDQFVGLRPLVTEDDTMLDFLTAPQIPEDKKSDLVKSVFADRVDRLFLEFLLVLVDKHRVNFLPEIIDEFDRLVKAEQGILQVRVITAVTLTDVEESQLVAGLASKTGLKIELVKKVDPSILGGMIVVMQNEIIDGSIRYYLETIREQLSSVKVH